MEVPVLPVPYELRKIAFKLEVKTVSISPGEDTSVLGVTLK